ncbi:MAG: response regulator [Candidatus Manganitrophus sp.]|nr:response regulator [Candidatus Manganitrophus sp.]
MLVAIDGEGTKEMIKELLSGASFKVVEANSGKEILPLLNRQRPAIALIDVGLPDGLGSEFCNMIKKDARLKETIVILMASIYEKNNKYRRQPSSLFGADDYIERHHVEKDLLVRIRKHLNRKQNGDSPVPLPLRPKPPGSPVLRETSMPSLEETARTQPSEMGSISPEIDQGKTSPLASSSQPVLPWMRVVPARPLSRRLKKRRSRRSTRTPSGWRGSSSPTSFFTIKRRSKTGYAPVGFMNC